MITLVLLAVASAVTPYMAYLKGMEDTTQGVAAVHSGTRNDLWHRRARRNFWLSLIGWFIPFGDWWLLVGLIPLAYTSFVAFRYGVLVGGGSATYRRWYGADYSKLEIWVYAPLRRVGIPV